MIAVIMVKFFTLQTPKNRRETDPSKFFESDFYKKISKERRRSPYDFDEEAEYSWDHKCRAKLVFWLISLTFFILPVLVTIMFPLLMMKAKEEDVIDGELARNLQEASITL